MMVTWFSDGQLSYNTMVDIDTLCSQHFYTFTLCSQQLRAICQVPFVKNKKKEEQIE